jgi:hypothetical protein
MKKLQILVKSNRLLSCLQDAAIESEVLARALTDSISIRKDRKLKSRMDKIANQLEIIQLERLKLLISGE